MALMLLEIPKEPRIRENAECESAYNESKLNNKTTVNASMQSIVSSFIKRKRKLRLCMSSLFISFVKQLQSAHAQCFENYHRTLRNTNGCHNSYRCKRKESHASPLCLHRYDTYPLLPALAVDFLHYEISPTLPPHTIKPSKHNAIMYLTLNQYGTVFKTLH
jgi:hypothetical protein